MVGNAPDFTAILELLIRHQVEFIVVGGVCAVLLGAPVTTFDLDIVHSRSDENLERLSEALQELEAHYRDHLPDQIEPTLTGLANIGHHLLTTKFGPLDVLGAIGDDDDYIALEDHIERVSISDELTIRILNLDTLIAVKQKTARSQDNYMLEILRAMKEGF